MSFTPYSQPRSYHQPDIEAAVLRFWQEHSVFVRSVETRADAQPYTFYEGPPSANGKPGIHHVLSRTLKDTFCRFQTLQGRRVVRKAGWDTHGLPIELQVEKKLGITKKDIGTAITVEEYNRLCRESVMEFKADWDHLTQIMGYWLDLNDPYITYENNYIESCWALLSKLFERGLLYKGYTIQPYSPAAGTGLSSHELNIPGCYREVKDTSAVAMFRWVEVPEPEVPSYFLAWTTTPWTLPSNAALAVGTAIRYLDIETLNPYTYRRVRVVLAEDLAPKYFSTAGENADFEAFLALTEAERKKAALPWKVRGSYTGQQLVGTAYVPLFNTLPVVQAYAEANPQAFRVIAADFVTTSDGTGIVHISPTFGADDKRAADAAGIPGVLINGQPIVDLTGKYSAETTPTGEPLLGAFAGRWVKSDYSPTPEERSLDVDLSIYLKEQGLAFKVEKYEHSYPHCWRTDKPVLYYPLDSWFIRTSGFREQLVHNNGLINWKPESTGKGRFENWLENVNDWNLSRSRFWGTPLPVWKTLEPTGEWTYCCIGSVADLATRAFSLDLPTDERAAVIQQLRSAENPSLYSSATFSTLYPLRNRSAEIAAGQLDLHKPYIDDILLIREGRVWVREPDLIDVWFDSGAMPYAQWHYPFENADTFERSFPADFIAEGIDQTRGWFYTLHAIATLVFDQPAFRNVIANGLVLDKDGRKMSKRLNNAIDPFETIGQYGADVVRWYMIENCPPWENLRFNLEHLAETQRKFFGTLYNTYSFFALYANIDEYRVGETGPVELTELDHWLYSRLESTHAQVQAAFEAYEPTQAARLIQQFVIDDLSNWYIRLCRRRYWKGSMTPNKRAAYDVLATVLSRVAQWMSPIAPFFADWLYRNLHVHTLPPEGSVHLTHWAAGKPEAIDPELEHRMAIAQEVCSLVRGIRRKHNLKVRYPLQKVLIPVLAESDFEPIRRVEDLIRSEVNVKAVVPVLDAGEAIVKSIKPNFKILGPKAGPFLKEIGTHLQGWSQSQISAFQVAQTADLTLANGQHLTLTAEDVEIAVKDLPGWAVASANGITVALDLTLTEELRQEGIARELVNRIQNLRKDLDFDVTDRIRIWLQPHEHWTEALVSFRDYIAAEVLALHFDVSPVQRPEAPHELDLDGELGYIRIERVS